MTRRFKNIPPLNKRWKAWGAREYSYYSVLGNKQDDRVFRTKALATHARAVKPDGTDIEIRYKEGDRDLNDLNKLGLSQAGPGKGANYISGDKSNNTVLGSSSHDYLIGLGGVDRLEAAAGNDFLVGQGDGDLLIGGEGEDYFQLAPSLSAQAPDQIQDFASAEGDRLVVDAPNINAQLIASLYIISHTEELSTAFENDALMIYSQNNGDLYYNQNGAAPGLGRGGLMAVLLNNPDVTVGSILLV